MIFLFLVMLEKLRKLPFLCCCNTAAAIKGPALEYCKPEGDVYVCNAQSEHVAQACMNETSAT